MASVKRSSSGRRGSGRGVEAEPGDNGYVHVLVRPLESGGLGLFKWHGSWPSSWVLCGCFVGCLVAYQAVSCSLAYLLHRLCSFVVPIFSLLCAYYWLCLWLRRSWSATSVYLVSCACFAGELIGQCLSGPDDPGAEWGGGVLPVRLFRPALLGCLLVSVTAASVLSSLPLWGDVTVVLFVSVARFFACTNLTDLPIALRPFVAYTCGVLGVIVAKYMETMLGASSSPPRIPSPTPDGKISVIRRRRSSSSLHGGVGPNKRRTSLPALSLQKNHHHLHSGQSSPSALDVALLAEAHGLITDMLADTNLPLHVASGLRALSHLLPTPTYPTGGHQRPRITPIVSLNDVNSGSDNEDIPCMGERLTALPKKFRRSLLRRMSTSTWTTTTSATGMPTLEPEPCRRRSTSFRHDLDSASSSPTHAHYSLVNQNLIPSIHERPAVSKHRSYSTTSLHLTAPSSTSPSHRSRLSRERKTVCSLHPLTESDITRLHSLSHKAEQQDSDGNEEEEGSTTPTPASPPRRLSPVLLPSVRRLNVTSDYESSDSPSGSDNNDTLITPPCKPVNRKGDAELQFTLDLFDTSAEVLREQVLSDSRVIRVEDGTEYDLERLASDPLLNAINEWDYPIFDVANQADGCVLSQMCYRVFLEVGLFDTFKIPVYEFLNYFRAIESGYRDKPYHNRMHAADVLQAVYYLTSQPIPGFSQLSMESEPFPFQRTDDLSSSVGMSTRQNFNAEDTYGILGANFPALELMALYVASAMHDYDHPGRTNAFLVMTHAPQAVLYNDRSVLENHHAAAAWSLFLSKPEYNFLVHLDKAEFKRFRFIVIEAILATDLKRHFEILAEFNTKVNDIDAPGIDWANETDRLLAMEMCIKLADINGPCKRHDIHIQWTYRIAEEFYEQGDEEASLGLPISPFMDRRNPQLAKLQESFINHLVAPLCNSYAEAALMPGQWVDASESEDEVGSEDKFELSDCTNTEEESVDNDHPEPKRPLKMPNRKISCLPTKYLKENRDYWVAVVKEEQRIKEEEDQKALAEAVPPLQKDPIEDEMETIHEEEPSGERSLRSSVDSDETSKL